jgi:hypothetical protein
MGMTGIGNYRQIMAWSLLIPSQIYDQEFSFPVCRGSTTSLETSSNVLSTSIMAVLSLPVCQLCVNDSLLHIVDLSTEAVTSSSTGFDFVFSSDLVDNP